MRVRSALLASLLVAAPVAAVLVSGHADGAENFACGAGGRPNPRTARCDCPSGKVERTIGGTSRCVERPTTAPTSTSNGTTTRPTGTTTAPTGTTTAPTGTTTMPTTPPPPVVTCPPGEMATPNGCVPLCAGDEIWSGGLCVPRCGHDERWNGARCERLAKPPKQRCQDDQYLDSSGHCCWPGQTWGEESQRCRGVPRCPPTHVADGETCVLAECDPAQHRVADGVHCCWEGQEWSRAAHRCVGIPECPEGYEQQGEACVAWTRCDAMHVAVDREHCCFPGQHWGVRDDGSSGCAGAPRCKRGYVARGEECVSEEKAEHDEEVVAKSELLGAKMIGIGFAYQYSPISSGGYTHLFGYAMQYHFANLPILFRGSLLIGIYKHSGEYTDTVPSGASTTTTETSAGTSYGYSVGLAFAPLSLPSAATSTSSWLNPFLGLDWYGIAYSFQASSQSSTEFGSQVTPSGSSGLFLSVGDTISIIDEKKNAAGLRGGLSLTVSYGVELLSKVDNRLSSALTIVGMYSAF